jgi:hypothetical protein
MMTFSRLKILFSIICALYFPITGTILAAEKVTVPSGRTIEVRLEQQIDTSNAYSKQPVTAILKKGFYDNGEFILPPHTKLSGHIDYLKKATATINDAELKLYFDTLKTPDGKTFDISAIIETPDGSGVIHASSKNKFGVFKKAIVKAGEETAITAAKTTVINKVTPKNIRNAISYTKTAGAGVNIVNKARHGDETGAAKETAKQVVKYTPYGKAYKYSAAAYKGAKSTRAAAQSTNENADGNDIRLKQGHKLELILLNPLTVSIN